MRVVVKLVAAAVVGIAAFLGFFVVLRGMVEVHQWGSGRFWSFAEAEAFLLPEGYEGPVTLVFDDPAGRGPVREGITRLYDLRHGRVIHTRAPRPEGRRLPDFYYVDSRGVRRHLVRGERCDRDVRATILVCAQSTRDWDARGREFDTWVIASTWRDAGAARSLGMADVEALRGR